MIDYLIGTMLMIFSTVFMLMGLWWGWLKLKSKPFTQPILLALIFYFAIYKVLAYYLLPLILGLFSGFRYVYEDNLAVTGVGFLYFVEMISWLPWLAGLFLLANTLSRKEVVRPDLFISINQDFSKIFLTTIVLAYIPFTLTIRPEVWGLLKQITLPIYLEVFKGLLSYTAPPAAIVIFIISIRKKWGIFYSCIGFVGFVISLGIFQTRGVFVYSFLLIAFLLWNLSKRKKVFFYKLLLSGFVFFLFYLSLGGIPYVEVKLQPSVEVNVMVGTEKKGNRSALEELEWRFGALSRMSSTFIRMYERGDGAGLNPILNSLAGFLPRTINKHKPHPSTVDGSNIYTQGMYMIYRETYGYNTFSMVEFSSGGHAYWELGLLGVLILPFVSAIYVGLCAFYFQRLGIASIPLLFTTFKPYGYVDPKIWVSDIAMQLYQFILPVLIIVFIYSNFGTILRFFGIRGRIVYGDELRLGFGSRKIGSSVRQRPKYTK